MLLTGLEPVCCIQQWILSPSCLPIPPQQHIKFVTKLLKIIQKQMMGVEPTTSAWKANVLPLNYICKRGFYLSQTGHCHLTLVIKQHRGLMCFPFLNHKPVGIYISYSSLRLRFSTASCAREVVIPIGSL